MNNLSPTDLEILSLKSRINSLELALLESQQELTVIHQKDSHPETNKVNLSSETADDIIIEKLTRGAIERGKKEWAIERGKKEWEATVDAVADMIILADERGNVIRCNRNTSRYFQKSYQELIGQPVTKIFYGNQKDNQQIFRTGSKEVQFPLLTGWFDVSNYPVVLNDIPYGMVHIVKDISAQRQIQNALRESQETLSKLNDELEIRVEQRTQELIETNLELQREIEEKENIQAILAKEKELLATTLLSIRDAVISTDKDGTIILFNKAAEMITGFSQAEVQGKPFNDIIKILEKKNNRITDTPLAILLEMKKSNQPASDITLLNREGDKLLISSSSAPVKNKDGELVGYVMVIDNVTERRRIEDQLALSQKMESIGQLAAGIAHEINTPMQYIGDNTHFLNDAFQAILEVIQVFEKIIDPVPEQDVLALQIQEIKELKEEKDLDFYIDEVPGAIQQSQEGIERVRKIVLAMKEFSHPSNKEKKPADINQGIETTVTISRNVWKYSSDLELDLDPKLPPVQCVIDEINQVILNLIINASQAIQEAQEKNGVGRGHICIKTEKQGESVLISLNDNGTGIPPAILNRIFDPFFTTKEVGKGTGQGLSLAHNVVVNNHKGNILVDSVVGKGITFTLRIPIQAVEPAEEPLA